MKKFLIIPLLCSAIFQTQAQNEKINRFSVGISIMPSINNVFYNSRQGVPTIVTDFYRDQEIPFIGIQGGLDVCYRINERFSIFSGFYHRDAGMNTKPMHIESAVVDPSLPKTAQWKYRFRYLSIPLEARLYVKGNVFVQAGIGFNILYDRFVINKYTYSDDRVETSKIKDDADFYNSVVFTGNFQTGYTFNREGRWNYNLSAFGSVGINGVAEKEAVQINRHIFSAGLNVSVCFSI